ncbi:MAG: hypothetical protein PVF34_09890 [Gammaproteobacteria bacterium]|jgi:hypothetical protein
MEPLKLSDELVKELQSVVTKYDDRASDAGIAVQYYAAIIGYVLAQQSFPNDQKKEFLDQLNAFSGHVFEDCIANTPPPAAEAMGKWRPGDP